jgi:hypothetical protein
LGAKNTLNPFVLPEMDAADLRATLWLGKNEVLLWEKAPLGEAVAGEPELCSHANEHSSATHIFTNSNNATKKKTKISLPKVANFLKNTPFQITRRVEKMYGIILTHTMHEERIQSSIIAMQNPRKTHLVGCCSSCERGDGYKALDSGEGSSGRHDPQP